ncbi:MAG: dinitrogenase iron-molybdenum cofactor [Peptococcaceae bacterium]|nr:MAG: dinitrogenase iron-molybdenum cofactor [Peptococcaceae bacterium]
MKIAVATDGNEVSSHFGHCPEFTIAEIRDGKLVSKEVAASPGHVPGFLPKHMAALGVGCVIAGGMGPRAQELLEEAGIKAVVGVSGPVDRAIEDFIAGRLVGGESSCSHGKDGHSVHGECGHGCHE